MNIYGFSDEEVDELISAMSQVMRTGYEPPSMEEIADLRRHFSPMMNAVDAVEALRRDQPGRNPNDSKMGESHE